MQAGGGDSEQLITAVRDRVGDEVERRVIEGVKERLREAVREGLEEAIQQRLQSAVRTVVSERLMARQSGGAGATGLFGGAGQSGGMGVSGASGTLVSALRERIASNLREGAKEDLRDRLESMLTEALETIRHERLDGAIREALAEQIALGSGFDVEQIAETVRDRIADPLASNPAHKFQERLGELLREHLVQAVRHVTSQGAMRGEVTAGASAMGLH